MVQVKKRLFSRISHWGVTPDLPPVFAKRITLTNLLGLLFTLNMSVSAIAFIYFELYHLAAFTVFFVLTEFSWPVFNRFYHYNISRVGLLVSSNLLGFFVSVLLPDTGYNHGFFVMAGIPILLFDLKEKAFIVLGLLLPMILYPISEWFQYQVPLLGVALKLSPMASELIHYSIGTVYVLLIFLMFLFISKENARAEKKLEEEQTRTFSSAKFAALGEMASGIGHEINNPLTVIELNIDQLKYVLKHEDNKEIALQRLEVISKTVQRMAKIINAMRSFSREASNDSFKKESIKKIVDETLIFCSERFKNHEVKLEVHLSPSDFSLNCRAVQLSQVLLNLLNNAFDAVEGLSHKWIKLEIVKDPIKKMVLISVTDAGKGISTDEQEKIFQPFFTTKPVGKGTGLGLSLSKKIVLDHGGTLSVDTASVNTKFVIELPE